MKVDIIGGGIAGLSTAISIKKNNPKIKVIVHEKHKKIGYNSEGRRCGEGHSVEKEWKKWKPLGKSIFNNIYKVETIIGDKTYILNRKKGASCILNRQEFIAQLGREAEKLGANINANHRIYSIKELDADYIIDASGCPSSVKRELNIKHRVVGKTYQHTLENSNYFISDTVKIFISENTGYFWIFPRNPDKKEINLGVGLINKHSSVNLKEKLEEFKEKNSITGKINYVTGGLIPVGLQKPFKYKNIFFVGDAGVGTFPYTGEGIYRALLSGDIAAKCICKNRPNSYPHEININFIKWDIIGRTILKFNSHLQQIDPKAAIFFNKKYLDLLHLFKNKNLSDNTV